MTLIEYVTAYHFSDRAGEQYSIYSNSSALLSNAKKVQGVQSRIAEPVQLIHRHSMLPQYWIDETFD